MGIPLKELWTRMDSEEFSWHVADYLIEPWGDDWRQVAKLCETIALAQGAKTAKWEHFMPPNRLQPPRKRQMTGKEIMDEIGAGSIQDLRQ